MRPPKNLNAYDASVDAGSKLINLAVSRILGLKPGIKVRWTLTLSYWSDDWTDPEKMKDVKVIPRSGSFSNL